MPPSSTLFDVPAATISAHALAIRHRDPEAARELAERAFAASAGTPGERLALVALGACLSVGPEALERGRALLLQALADCEEEGDAWLACEVRNELAAGYLSTNQLDAARTHLAAALEEARRAGRRMEEARALRLLGSVDSTTGDFGGALARLLEALRVHESVVGERPAELDDAGHWERGSLFARIGIVYSNLDQFEQALAYYEVALESFRERFPHRAGRTLYRMGIAVEEMGALDRAEDFYRRSLALHGAHGHRQARAVSLMGVGNVLRMRGETDAAEAALSAALAELEGDPVYRAFSLDGLWMLAEVHLERGDPRGALPLLERALPLYDEFARPAAHRAALHARFHRAYRMLGDAERALEHHEAFHAHTVRHLQDRADARLAEMMARFDTERARKEGEVSRLRSEALEREVAERREVEAALARAKAELEERNRELHALTIRDALTGLYNRRHLDERLGEAFALARRHGQPLCVMICDVDDFKRINDTFSHAVGDEVLRAIAGILRENLRRSDVAARFGGEEFVVLFPGIGRAQAAAAARKLCARVRAHPWGAVHPGLSVTLSAGVACAAGHPHHERLLSEADGRLYEAKRAGKDRVVG